jgi:tyrosine-protein kinase Etk/Wzc
MAIYPEIDTTSAVQHSREDTVDILELAVVLATYWRRIALATFVALLLGVLFALMLKPVFTAKAIILPPQQQQSSLSSMLGAFGSLASLGGSGTSSLLKSPSDMYIGILKSETIANQVIQQNRLESVYHAKTLDDARRALEKHSDFDSAKDGLIHISVTDGNPRRASDIANAYIDALYNMNASLAITDASQRRLFFSRQVDEEKAALNKAEDAFAATQLKTGLLEVSGQSALLMRTIAEVQAQISADQVALQGLLTSSTEQNPDVHRLRQEIATLQGQLNQLQDNQKKLGPGDIEVPAGHLPGEAIEYTRKMRDLKYHETLYELLAKQYEAARIDEAKSAPLIQVIDRATPPQRKSGPWRALIVLGFGIGGFFCACIWALVSNAIKRMSQVPENNVRFQQLRASFRLRQ